MKKKHPQIIAICGGSGSGKSTLAKKFIGASILSTDSFYRDLSNLVPAEDGSFDFDHPSAVALDELAIACQKLAAGEDVTIPVYDMRSSRRVGKQIVAASPKRIVVVEGIFAFHSPLAEVSTLKIFIDTPIDQRMARRLRRDVERGRSTLDTIRHSLLVEEAYTRNVEPMKGLADLVLMGEEMHGSFTL
jgi:uridine kinase